ncbi:hypothetical protein Sjap_020948 [Stephania japonica]|uniref:Uncharacterized protein n=1 Tax=Stephania japonica TaxID=461633 RepID=A0AAP0I129_9MAGN
MIRLCTCNGGPASSLELNRRRGLASCKTCGGKPLVNESGSFPSRMVSPVGLELASIINPDWTWKKVSKGNRSASRRARKPNSGNSKVAGDWTSKNLNRVEDIPVSESEKLEKRKPALAKGNALNLRNKNVTASENAVSDELDSAACTDLSTDGKEPVDGHGRVDLNEDFSGISILAAAACSSSIEGGAGPDEENFIAEDSLLKDRSAPQNTETCIVVGESCKELSQTHAEVSSSDGNMFLSPVNNQENVMSLEGKTDILSRSLPQVAPDVSDVSDLKYMTLPHLDNLATVSQASKTDDGTTKRPKSSCRDERSHWDLNVSMDSWASPSADPYVDYHGLSGDYTHGDNRNNSDDFGDLITSRNMENVIDRTASTNPLLSELGNGHESLQTEAELAHNSEVISSSAEVICAAPIEHTSTFSNMATASVPDEIALTQSTSLDTGNGGIPSPGDLNCNQSCRDYFCSGIDHDTSRLVLEEPVDKAASVEKMLTEDMTVQASSLASFDDTKSEKLGSSLGPVHPNSESLITLATAVAEAENLFACASKTQDNESSSGNSIRHDSSIHIDKGSNDKVPNVKVEEVCLLRQKKVVAEKQVVSVSLNSQDNCKRYCNDLVTSSGRYVLEEEPYDDSECDYGSVGSHMDHINLSQIPKAGELQEDNETQYEDGELRESESDEHNWADCVDEEGEVEHVDYESDNRETDGEEGASDYPSYLVGQVKETDRGREISMEVHDINSEEYVSRHGNRWTAKSMKNQWNNNFDALGDQSKFELVHDSFKMRNGRDDFSMENAATESNSQLACLRSRSSGWDRLPEAGKCSKDMFMDSKEGSSGKNHGSACIDGLDFVAGYGKRELRRTERKTGSDASLWKDRTQMHRSRSSNLDDLNSRVERDTTSSKSYGRGGSSLHMHGRGRGVNRWIDSSGRRWDTNSHRSPSYYGPGFVHSAAAKLESSGLLVAPDGTIVKAVSVRPGARVHRQSLNGSSQCVQRPLTRRGSPAERKETFRMHMGSAGAGRSRRYGQRVFGTDLRERHHDSGPTLHSLPRREQSISPSQRRGTHHFSRSQSRSRSLSPHLWPTPRGRVGYGLGLRQCSRSPPNFRSEERLHRVRSPHHQPGFVVDHVRSFGYTLRSRASPPRTARWVDDRRDTADYFRENCYKHRSVASRRSSPGRLYKRGHKFDLIDPPFRVRADAHHKHMQHGRFSEMAGAGREPRYDGSDDDKRKHGDRYGFTNSVRHHNADETIKHRHRYGAEDTVVSNNSRSKDTSGFHGRGSPREYIRAIDSRLVDAWRGREDGNFRYARDENIEKHNTPSKSGAIQECNEDTTPRRRLNCVSLKAMKIAQQNLLALNKVQKRANPAFTFGVYTCKKR